ncbi:MAG: DEAD/DEAH box helicase [Caldilineaceae bacterium]|nr:DEAD/DEAH box helicase [Caldilineaceae bacterium]
MNVFDLRDRLITDYAQYIRSFIHIQDGRIRQKVQDELERGLLWPEPLLQLNPNFEPGAWIDDLVKAGTLHEECRRIFRLKEDDKPERPLRLHRHQTDAVEAASSRESYVLTTGTGSGKSLAYIVPIVNYVLQHGSGKGIRAIVVYPMNALANSQYQELEKFLRRGYPPGKEAVTFARYTGQEKEAERKEILANPPDILLTNYVMLELMLTRTDEQHIVNSVRGQLQFLVLDELHTYRGRQGADVAMLVRRLRDLCENSQLQCVGTSATLAGAGSLAEQKQQIAGVASRFFGVSVKPERVIGETLRRATRERDENDPHFRHELCTRLTGPAIEPPSDYDAFINDPLSSWIESTFGLAAELESGRLRRAQPTGIGGEEGAAARLTALTGVAPEHCAAALQAGLLAGYQVVHPETGFPVFAFRLHQFISRGDTVYATLGEPSTRYITTHAQQFMPNNRTQRLLPLAFCRECGQEYYIVQRVKEAQSGASAYIAREFSDQAGAEGEETGFLYRNPDNPWPEQLDQMVDRLPEDWWVADRALPTLRRDRQKALPQPQQINPLGKIDPGGDLFHFIKTPFAFCLNCGVSYDPRQRSDYGKLASLSSEGRSTATTVLSLAALRALRRDETLERKARKLLSFTDNRQDASLQAGHFNDFVEVSLLRSAIYQAVLNAGDEGLTDESLPLKVFAAINLPFELYAVEPELLFAARQETERALREVLAYRVYQDLRRGWRVTSPNLEQVGLLRIEYKSLDDLCAYEDPWKKLHPALADALPETRAKVAKTLLDYLRRELAIKVDYLRSDYQETIQQRSSQRLKEPWALDEQEVLAFAKIAFPRSRTPHEVRENLHISARGGFGSYLRRPATLPHYRDKLSLEEAQMVIRDLFEALRLAGLVERVTEEKKGGDAKEVPGYQVPASSLVWKAGDTSEPFHDPIRVPQPSRLGHRVNPFFAEYYRSIAATLQGYEAREHTAQVPSERRQEREERFRNADLPVLYCSPTMELGVDIAQLNAVNLRNVPPTPANYAQRSGRAGRSGQPALVFTYCTTGSPHDQYFFRRPQQMVSGVVAPPRLELANEDLLRAHAYAVWLTESKMYLGTSLKDLLDLTGENPSLAILPEKRIHLDSESTRRQAAARLERIFHTIEGDLAAASWYTPDWVQRQLDHVADNFDRACERWRNLYRSAMHQREVHNRIIGDASRSPQDKDQAARLRREAEDQMRLLTENKNLVQSDFYSYRYFASESFLPGYNFPRLPLSAYIPGRKRAGDDEYLNRPRFLAISEFGPRSIIYHEGSRYIVNRVILPVDEGADRGPATGQAKLCPRCGYLHPIIEGESNPDRCEQCNAYLDGALQPLMRMQNVTTKRRDRINSDEEERTRMGYELRTGVRFGLKDHVAQVQAGQVVNAQGEPLFQLTYGHAATLWRINMGWRRRKDPNLKGFVLDIERGYWERNEAAGEDDPDDPKSNSKIRVIPYVDDRRNCLLIEPAIALSYEQMASLQPALKNAIQVRYQLEDNELAVEPLPNVDERWQILLYESAEGGAGVLRQLIEDPNALTSVARQALTICHFDPDTGEDQRRGLNSREDCEAACYDCLMSYSNQPDHRFLDRMLLRDLLLQLAGSRVEASPSALPRAEHLRRLKAECDSDLERQWLDFIDRYNLRLPDEAQKSFATAGSRVDFYYRDQNAVIFIDGSYHDSPEARAKDQQTDDKLIWELSLEVVRFHHSADWRAICAAHAHIFGNLPLE